MISSAAEIGKAPQVLQWPAGLPDFEPQDGGTFMPVPLDKHVRDRLRHYQALPHVCQVHLDELANVHRAELSSALAIRAAELGAVNIETQRDQARLWRWWEAAILAIGAGALGVVIGWAAR